jgi:2-polyprenyl-3-methyl-5-hydroxy-6-metoxy-1,4-benzoquinol methylase
MRQSTAQSQVAAAANRAMPPGKTRYIGQPHAGAEPFRRLVATRYSLDTARDPQGFLARVAPYASLEAYNRWLNAYKAQSGSFLEHPAWGADRELGGGRWLYGAMDDRYATNAARAFGPGGLDAGLHIVGKRVCVVGAWDGTESLLLSALGAASVDAMDEVPAFCDMTQAQYDAWDISGQVLRTALYEVDPEAVWQKYDLLYVPGVLYHLTDVVAAMVLCWTMLRPGGTLAFESVADMRGSCSARYIGASATGWNWWSPTPDCYESLLRDCGFPDGRTVEYQNNRGWWVGTRGEVLPALSAGAAGFSRPDLLRSVRRLSKSSSK